MMMIGGLYLCFEGFEKVAHKLLHSKDDAHAAVPATVRAASRTDAEHLEAERGQIKGAIRTDFILSAEIIVISIGTMADAPIAQQVVAVSLIALGATVLVYGLVAGIVKLDDLGLALHRTGPGARRTIGDGILRATPIMLKSLSVLGTAAMFTVGGSILMHGLPPVEHLVVHTLDGLAAEGSALRTALNLIAEALVGVVAGGIAVLAWTGISKLLPKREKSPASSSPAH